MMNKKNKILGNVFKIAKASRKINITEKNILKTEKDNSKTVKYGAVPALKEHMLKGNKVSRIESLVIFGVQNFTAVLSILKKDRFIIKKQPVTMAKIIRRMNEYCDCKPPKNLPTKEITMHEWWVSK